MNKLTTFFERIYLNSELSFDEKIINFTLFINLVMSFVTMFVRAFRRDKPFLILTASGIVVSCIVLIYFFNKFRIFHQVKFIACVLICDVLFPSAYFSLGGINSSICANFVLSTVIVFLLAYGRWFHVFIFTHIMLVVICYLVEFRYPHLVSYSGQRNILVDNIQSFLIISLTIGLMFMFQRFLYTRENEEFESTETENIRHANLLRVINTVARILLTADTGNFESAIDACLGLMGRSVNVDRIIVWKNIWKDGQIYYSTLCSWEESANLRRDHIEFSYDMNIAEFRDKLFNGKQYSGPVSTLSPAMRKRLADINVKSVLVIPVFLQDTFWGFVSFDDCQNERLFPDDETTILKSGALMVVSAARQNDIEGIIRESNERIRIMLDASPLCSSLLSDDFHPIDCNEAATKLFGLNTKQEYIANYKELSPEFQPNGRNSEEFAADYFEEVLEKGKVRFEWMNQKKDGTPLPVEKTFLHVFDGSTNNILSYTRDLSEHKKMIAAIEKKEALLYAINEAAAILLKPRFEDFVSDLTTSMGLMARVVKADRMSVWKNSVKDGKRYTTQIYEWTEDVEPQQDSVFTTDLCYEEKFPELEAKLSAAQVVNGPVKNLSRNEQDMLVPQGIVSLLDVPVFIQDEFWGFVGFDDCKHERNFEESEVSILHSASLLIATAVIQNEMTQKLVQTREEALLSSKAKSAFLATMSHEIRTPLNAIIGLAEIQEQRNIPPQTKSDLEKIYLSGATLLGIINEMLDISKIESGSFDLVPIEYDVPSLINDAVQLNIVRIGSKPIAFELSVDEYLPSVLFGDELRVKQILNNILSNAFKYTREGSVTLNVEWQKAHDSQSKDAVVFSVCDTGIGIKQEDIGKLFGEYMQLDLIKNRKIEGTGLGLFITKKLIDLMDGTITVQSEYGKGSCFIVHLPQKAISQRCIGKEVVDNLKSFNFMRERRSRAQNLERSYMPYGKVLIVDDVQTNLDVARGLMSPYGMTIDCVLGGREAIESVRKENVRYDIIFMDHMMPEMDGIEAVRIIRNEIDSAYAKTVPIIALTANALAGNEEMFLRNGFDAFISKPIDIMRLDSLLNQFIRDRQSAQTLKEAEEQAKQKKSDALVSFENNDENSLPVIDGIDIQAGIEHYSDKKIFEGILSSYMQHTPKLLEILKNLSPETLKDYAITVHGLKSASYGILANDLGKRAEELEALSKAGEYDQVLARNERFLSDMQKLIEDISAALAATAPPESQKVTKDSIDTEILKIILESAKHFKTIELENAVAKLAEYEYTNKADSDLAAWLRDQTESLEYDAICDRLEREAMFL